MKNLRTISFVAVVLFLCACPALGLVEFNDGLTHDIDYAINDDVWVDYQAPYMYTTVNWLTGARIVYPNRLSGYENSRINIRGGLIGGWLGFYSYDSSQIDISGGEIGDLASWDSSRVNISGGLITHLWSQHSSQVNVSGGEIHELSCWDSSRADISWCKKIFASIHESSQLNVCGGEIGWIDSYDSGQVNISGGSIGYLDSGGSSQVNISGGLIRGDDRLSDLSLWDQSKIQIFGSDFAVDGQPFGYGEITSILGGYWWDEPIRYLTGTLISGELIDCDFRIGDDARIVLVPEPASALLMTLGTIIITLRRKKR